MILIITTSRMTVLSDLEYNKRSMIVYIVSGDVTHAFNNIIIIILLTNVRVYLTVEKKKKDKVVLFCLKSKGTRLREKKKCHSLRCKCTGGY